MGIKFTKTHQWLEEILTKEFQNWTRDPFEETEDEKYNNSFGNISIFYIIPTPETNASHIILTFVVYNA
ncbi:uncharacterized protein CEXT_219201 [Caerostris extrusa]|uniref:Uncharacterized protein n=1 Tax=Caerostris extrusa TaxID=172846 RepID=A0AAV4XMF6_CAEEX|nr:uncharacterized protein CEXT_219201 [Caerostris extrusa]